MNLKMTIKLLLLSALMLGSYETYAEAIKSPSKKIISVKEQELNLAKKELALKQEKEANKQSLLISDYGFTIVEADKFIELQQQQEKKLKSISASNSLSKEQKRTEMLKAIESYHQLLESTLSPSQYATFKTKVANAQERKKRERTIEVHLRNCRRELSQIGNVSKEQRKQKEKEIINKYTLEVSKLIPADKAKKRVMNAYYQRVAMSKAGKNHNLSEAELIASGKVIARSRQAKDSIATLDIWYKSKNKRRKNIDNRQEEVLIALVGESATNKLAPQKSVKTHYQKYAEDYGFTKEQYEKLKKIENKYAVERMAIMKSAIPMEEKQTAVKKIYWKKIAQLKKLIPPHQYEEWLEMYRKYNKPKTVNKKKNNQPKS